MTSSDRSQAIVSGVPDNVSIGFVFRSPSHATKYEADRRLLLSVIDWLSSQCKTVDFQVFQLSSIERGHFDLPADLICSMSRDYNMIAMLSILEEKGAAVVNTTAATLRTINRGLTYELLARQGVAVPRTFIAPASQHGLSKTFIAKPLLSTEKQPQSIAKIDGPSQALPYPERHIILQERIESGLLRKCYVVGNKCTVRRIAGAYGAEVAGKGILPQEDSEQSLRDIAFKCGGILGLEIFNVDLLTVANTHYVVDVNDFPSFEGIPSAPEMIAAYLLDRTRKLHMIR